MTLSLYDKAAEARLLENKQMAMICAELNRLYSDGLTFNNEVYYVQVSWRTSWCLEIK